MTITEFVTRIRREFAYRGDVTDALVRQVLGEVFNNVSRKVRSFRFCQGEATLTTVAGQKSYSPAVMVDAVSGAALVKALFLAPLQVSFTDANGEPFFMQIYDWKDFDKLTTKTVSSQLKGYPLALTTYSGSILLFPTPDVVVALTVKFLKRLPRTDAESPLPVGSPILSEEILTDYSDILIEGCKWKLWGSLRNGEEEDRAFARFRMLLRDAENDAIDRELSGKVIQRRLQDHDRAT